MSKIDDMDKIDFKRLSEIPRSDFIELMNDPKVVAQMPLAKGEFDESAYEEFLLKKEDLWRKNGFGPWAFLINDEFAGWGGIQPEMGEADLVMVLSPRFWGYGRQLINLILKKAFFELNRESVVVLLPPTRNHFKALLRIGFIKEGEVDLYGEKFNLFRLTQRKAQAFLGR